MVTLMKQFLKIADVNFDICFLALKGFISYTVAAKRCFPVQNDPKNLDMSCKTDLDFVELC